MTYELKKMKAAPVLSIIIPHYREQWAVGKQFFNMLACQRQIDFDDVEVIIANDGQSNVITQSVFDRYPYNVVQLALPHRGVSAARNAGLDAARGEWVMFCDFDDAFYHTLALRNMFDKIEAKLNIISGGFYQEVIDRAGQLHMKKLDGRDCVFVHGKMFRRSWLAENELRFNEDLTLHEDSYFVTLAEFTAYDGEVAVLEDPVYLWQWNPKSVTRYEPNFVMRTFSDWAKKTEALLRELVRRGKFSCIKIVVCDACAEMYCNFCRKSWGLPEYAGKVASCRRELAGLLWRYREVIDAIRPEDMARRVALQRDVIAKSGDFIDLPPAFEMWIKEIIREGEMELNGNTNQ